MDKRIKYLLIGIFIFLLLWMLYHIQVVIAYVLISVIVGMIGRPLVWKLQKIKIKGRQVFSNTIAAALVLVTFLTLISSFIGLIIPVVVEEAKTIANISESTNNADPDGPIIKLGEVLQNSGIIPANEHPRSYLILKLKKVMNMGEISKIFSEVLGSLGSILMGLFAVLFISFYFLQD